MPIRVSIVEDVQRVREVIQERISQEQDMECAKSFTTGEAALGGILLDKPDVVIMDIGLPGMSGTACMVKIKYKYPTIKFLMFTIFDNDENVFEALKAGADGYILKSESPDKIIQSIREVMNHGAPMSRAIARKVLDSFQKTPKANTANEQLSDKQKRILEELAKGLPYVLIADNLGITEGTLKQHIHRIYRTLQVNNRTEAIKKYLGEI